MRMHHMHIAYRNVFDGVIWGKNGSRDISGATATAALF